MRLAVADDDRDVTAWLTAALAQDELSVDVFNDGAALKRALLRDTYDAVLLDWNMPGLTGFEIVQWAAASLPDAPPLLMMTSRSDEGDIVAALEAGASDYILKPASGPVVRARILAAARERARASQQQALTCGNYVIDSVQQSISLNGEPVRLTMKEFQLAALLFDNLDRPLSRTYLLAEVWSADAGVETRTLDMHVSRIRSKLALRPENNFVLQTVFGFGYRLSRYRDGEE